MQSKNPDFFWVESSPNMELKKKTKFILSIINLYLYPDPERLDSSPNPNFTISR